MDKKTILAFVLIGVIILLYQEYLDLLVPGRKAQIPVRNTEQIAGIEKASPRQNTLAARSDTGTAVQVQRAKSNEQVIAENDLLRIVLNTRGGAVSSIVLKDFQSAGGGRVDLIKPGSAALTVFGESNGMPIDLSDAEFVPDKPELRVGGQEVGRIVMVSEVGDGKIEKVFELSGNRYGIGVSLGMRGATGLTRLGLRWNDGINVAEKNRTDDLGNTKAYTYMGGELESLECKDNQAKSDTLDGKIGWVGLRSKYFFIGLAPADGGEYLVNVTRQKQITGDKSYDIAVSWSATTREEGKRVLLYAGPLVYNRLQEYGVGLERAVDMGWWVIRPFSQVILWLFEQIHRVVPNYGIVLVLFALLVKIAVYPLTRKTYQSSQKMQQLQPKLAALKERYKDDQAKLGQETMKLYKEAGVNPAGGCLPLVLQMPIFFALYKVFSSTIELRQAPFFWWLGDLSQPDPYYILPILMGISMFVQQKMTVTDPKQAMMVYLMPVMMTFFFLKVSSGLVLYWTVFNLLSIVQQELIDKRRQPAEVT